MSTEDDAKARSQHLDELTAQYRAQIRERLDKSFLGVKNALESLDRNIDRSFDRLGEKVDRNGAATRALLRELVEQDKDEPE